MRILQDPEIKVAFTAIDKASVTSAINEDSKSRNVSLNLSKIMIVLY